MCTVIVRVPEQPGASVRLLAVRDEDPTRSWDRLGPWWPDELPGVVGVRDARAGGAWLAADPARSRLAVVLNRADVLDDAPASRGRIVLDAVAGRPIPDPPRTHGFNLVQVTADGVEVTMWDGASVRTIALAPGVHMIAHDDVDDAQTPRIVHWQGVFASQAVDAGADWREEWLATLARSAELTPTDDRAIIRDNRPHGYPTLSLLVCTAEVGPDGADVRYAEFAEPGRWNSIHPA
ncbi:NRDE family protein [Microbacterium sp. bgisy189]|uniref:NRDE family protein n=1 Tax=Microbacterium sp. bgisy189 TaxID=3413798 RepID=UPI003EBFB320